PPDEKTKKDFHAEESENARSDSEKEFENDLDAPEEEFNKEKQSIADKIAAPFRKADSFLQKGKDIYKSIRNTPDKTAILQYTVELLKDLRRAVKVKRHHLRAEFGFDDPAATGYVAGILYAVKPFFLPKAEVRVNLENPGIRLDAVLRGHSSFLAILYPIIKYVIKKPIWGIIKRFLNRKEEAK
ncbi:MAG: DUF2953 domain-containing protein, partial [Clostridiales bacterium]|nr:DUF2953 domain-containing protein [Clostridiales bacterium]